MPRSLIRAGMVKAVEVERRIVDEEDQMRVLTCGISWQAYWAGTRI